MKTLRVWASALALWAISGLWAASAAADNGPVFDFQNVMDTYFDDASGLISFGDYTVAFAPKPPFKGIVAVVDRMGTVVAQYPFMPDYRNRQGVYARVQVQGPADVTLTEPGIYTIVFLVDGKPVTRFPVRLEKKSAGKDPFNPEPSYRFDGYWRTMAYFTESSFKDQPIPELNLWVGGKDLPPGADKGRFSVTLLRDGKLVAHSKRTQGVIPDGHFKRTRIGLFHPHTEKDSPNAKFFTMQDMQVDGAYEVRVVRLADGKVIRSYDFDVADGKIQRLPKAQPGYTPGTDYVLPKVLKKGATGLEMTDAIWIQHRTG